MKKSVVFILSALILGSCATPKQSVAIQDNSIEAAIEIAVTDFLKCRSSKKSDAFSITIHRESLTDRYKISDDLILVDIFQAFIINHITLLDTLGSTALPTRYIIKGGKLFYWDDPDYGLTEEMVNVLWKYKIADSVSVSDKRILTGCTFPEDILGLKDLFGFEYVAPEGFVVPYVDELTEGVDYYFCKNNVRKYKRIITHTAPGWYKPPKVNCNCKK